MALHYLGIGTSAIIPIAYSLASKAKGIDSGAAIAIMSIAVYGTFMGLQQHWE